MMGRPAGFREGAVPDLSRALRNLDARVGEAVRHFWITRERQARRQGAAGRKDQGARSAVTGGAQMDGFIGLLTEVILATGLEARHIYHQRALELPGFFRPTKEWDLLVVKEGRLVAAIEAKSQAGPSFGNNFNNRTEEAMGSAMDLWTAYREGAFNRTARPWGTSSCWRTARAPAGPSPSRSRTSKSSPNSKGPPTHGGTNSSAGNSSGRAITARRLF